MSKLQRSGLVTVAALVVLVYIFHGSSARGSELEIRIDFWGLLAFVAVLVFGIRWVRRAPEREAP
jgi:hypothetical protein